MAKQDKDKHQTNAGTRQVKDLKAPNTKAMKVKGGIEASSNSVKLLSDVGANSRQKTA